MDTTRNASTAVFVVAALVVMGGCLTVSPTVETGDSDTFRNVTTDNQWGTSSVQATVTFSSSATTADGVSRVNVITESGGSFYSTTLDAGQTTVSLPLPTGAPATLYAVNTTSGSVVATQNVTVEGSTIP
ncbi:hypothetical protein [Saliphagus sp. LR7]|uniref:hypothetical protein n=1 Tax=Saliphagus sp. LR7 TaxID=2282654 RepID=UPI000DF7C480|nr:hypothetical protein [Saliphagus sp. LR7]